MDDFEVNRGDDILEFFIDIGLLGEVQYLGDGMFDDLPIITKRQEARNRRREIDFNAPPPILDLLLIIILIHLRLVGERPLEKRDQVELLYEGSDGRTAIHLIPNESQSSRDCKQTARQTAGHFCPIFG